MSKPLGGPGVVSQLPQGTLTESSVLSRRLSRSTSPSGGEFLSVTCHLDSRLWRWGEASSSADPTWRWLVTVDISLPRGQWLVNPTIERDICDKQKMRNSRGKQEEKMEILGLV